MSKEVQKTTVSYALYSTIVFWFRTGIFCMWLWPVSVRAYSTLGGTLVYTSACAQRGRQVAPSKYSNDICSVTMNAMVSTLQKKRFTV